MLEEKYEDLYDNLRDMIKEFGNALIGVPGFVYTIGNSKVGLPELLLVGNFDHGSVALILNDLSKTMRERGEAFPEGMLEMEGYGFPFKVRKASDAAKEEYTVQAGQCLRTEDYDVLQIIICDRDGKYPGDEGCDPNFNVEMA